MWPKKNKNYRGYIAFSPLPADCIHVRERRIIFQKLQYGASEETRAGWEEKCLRSGQRATAESPVISTEKTKNRGKK